MLSLCVNQLNYIICTISDDDYKKWCDQFRLQATACSNKHWPTTHHRMAPPLYSSRVNLLSVGYGLAVCSWCI